MSTEEQAYILGTDKEELWRLGFQHQVWSTEARKGWQLARFSKGDHLLDLGSGPGFCTIEMAYICGEEGRVTAVDKSKNYIDHLKQLASIQHLQIDTQCCDFQNMELLYEHYDGVYCRWAMAWISSHKEVIAQVAKALKPGGRFVIQEYFNFSTLHIEPELPGLKIAIDAIQRSYEQMDGNIDIGKKLPALLEEAGLKVVSVRELNKLGTPKDLVWHWPKTFFKIYLPKLVDMGLMSKEQMQTALADFDKVEQMPGAQLMGPSMIEIIAQKQQQ